MTQNRELKEAIAYLRMVVDKHIRDTDGDPIAVYSATIGILTQDLPDSFIESLTKNVLMSRSIIKEAGGGITKGRYRK